MTKKLLPEGSARALSDYVAEIDGESRHIIDQALVALASELEGNQHLIHAALIYYRDTLIDEPSADEFYDLVAFIGQFTADFNESRIDTSIYADSVFSAWQERKEAPYGTSRRYVMLALIDSAIAEGLLSGVGRLNDWLDFASGHHLPGNWLLVGQVHKLHEKVPDEFRHWYTPLTDLDWFRTLPVRVRTLVKNKGYTTLGQLLMVGKKDMKKGSNFGSSSLLNLEGELKEHGLVLGSVTQEEYNRYAP